LSWTAIGKKLGIDQRTVQKVSVIQYFSNNSSFHQKHPGVPDGSESYDGTSYPQTENYTLPIAQATGPSLLD
jgi:hypothetical protein